MDLQMQNIKEEMQLFKLKDIKCQSKSAFALCGISISNGIKH